MASSYEDQRSARLEENKRRMAELGISHLAQSLSSSKKPRRIVERGNKNDRIAAAPSLPVSCRRSSRLSGLPMPSYDESDKGSERVKMASRRGGERLLQGSQPEVYTEEHEKLLGDFEEEWELFKDGYAQDGTRIYDPVNGKTCHQCRQKTLGLRTWCNECQSLRGQFCGDCLYMRYGENVLEANRNKEWKCPYCRGICNCSFCRLKKGWVPTGSMYRYACGSLGYKSVAHYLIMTKRQSTEAPTQSATTKALEEEVAEVEEEEEEENCPDTPPLAVKALEEEEKLEECKTAVKSGKKGDLEENSNFPGSARRSLAFSLTESNEPHIEIHNVSDTDSDTDLPSVVEKKKKKNRSSSSDHCRSQREGRYRLRRQRTSLVM